MGVQGRQSCQHLSGAWLMAALWRASCIYMYKPEQTSKNIFYYLIRAFASKILGVILQGWTEQAKHKCTVVTLFFTTLQKFPRSRVKSYLTVIRVCFQRASTNRPEINNGVVAGNTQFGPCKKYRILLQRTMFQS